MTQPPPHAFITGAARRIGREVARRLASQGYRITAHYRGSKDEARSLQAEIAEQGGRCHLVCGDLDAYAEAGALLDQAWEEAGPVTLLVHNASRFARDTLETLGPEELEAHMRVNLYSPLMLTQALARRLGPETGAVAEGAQESGREPSGHVICFSDGVDHSLSPAFFSYAMSKLALEQAVVLLAKTLAPVIRVNGVAPGATIPGAMDGPDTFAALRARAPLKRHGSAEDVAEAVLALERLPAVTGQILVLSGGMRLAL